MEKKVIRITESQLKGIVKKVINEITSLQKRYYDMGSNDLDADDYAEKMYRERQRKKLKDK